MYFKKIRGSDIHKIMASLDDQKIYSWALFTHNLPIGHLSYDLENGSKCCLKTLKNGQNWGKNGPENPEIGIEIWIDTLITIFCHFQQLWQAAVGKRIKIENIAAQRFKKSLSRFSILKIKVLAQILRPLYFFPNSKFKIT